MSLRFRLQWRESHLHLEPILSAGKLKMNHIEVVEGGLESISGALAAGASGESDAGKGEDGISDLMVRLID